MNYNKTIEYLFHQLPFYQNQGPKAYKADLSNTIKLDEYFNSPHKKYKTIHIAGTNGKGSVANILASILQKSGYKIGLYTSPHLIDFRERIQINNEKISKKYVTQFVNEHKSIIKKINPSFFEITVAMALKYFKDKEVDFAVIEVGLGGRLDSTNIINPILSIITNISLDHTNILGDTLPEIAKEKAGIIKANTPVIIGEKNIHTDKIFMNVAKKEKSNLHFADDYYSIIKVKSDILKKNNLKVLNNFTLEKVTIKHPLKGKYQEKNILTSLAAINKLSEIGINIDLKNIKKGLRELIIPGRFQLINKKPIIICDTGHNIAALEFTLQQIKNTNHKNLHIVIGFVNDKEINKILSLLPKNAKYYFTQANQPRALNYTELEQRAKKTGLSGSAYKNINKAIIEAKINANKKDIILITGSTFVVAEALSNTN